MSPAADELLAQSAAWVTDDTLSVANTTDLVVRPTDLALQAGQ
jgi:hypothetical protein